MIRSKDNFLQVSDGAWIYFEGLRQGQGGADHDPPWLSLLVQIFL